MKQLITAFLRPSVAVVMLLIALPLTAQDYKNWVKQAPRLPDSFFFSDSCEATLHNVLASQLPTGAWGKNINFFRHREAHPEDVLLGTIDNHATITEIRFLLRYASLHPGEPTAETSLAAALRGIRYLLDMQYANGGFPQYYPRRDHYHGQITFNDNAMLNALSLLRDASRRNVPFTLLPDTLSHLCEEAFQRGIRCILRCQIVRDGHPTVWCQQHDSVTLAPCGARAFELPSFVSAESADIVMFLMTLPTPSDSIRHAVEGAMRWYRANAISGIQKERFTDAQGREDYRMAPCAPTSSPSEECPRLWARFYDLDTCSPFFCGRDGIPRSHVEDIDHERRNGYAWYVTSPERLFPLYEKWLRAISR